jgi:polyferredoxin
MDKSKTSAAVWLRRLSQTLFLLLFLYLFLATTYRPGNEADGMLTLFFDLDPLVMVTVWLGGHAVASALFLSFITLAATLVFGRWFCGWVCPFGTLHQFFSRMKKGKKKALIQAGRYTAWQKSKYYVLVGLLVSALFGVNLAGWIDPFSFFYRAMATAVFPAFNAGIQGVFDWFYEVNPLHLSAVSEPIYRVLRNHFLMMGQPHFFWGALLGVLFGAVIILNLFRGRFWCRYICPLGGMLGIVGKNPVLRLEVNPDKCSHCMKCVAACPTAADPRGQGNWRPSECIYCWKCESDCPENAITFQFKAPGGERS